MNKKRVAKYNSAIIGKVLVNYDALSKDDFDEYYIDRAKALLLLIEKAMGKQVSDRDSDTTIEQFGRSLL